MDRKSQTKKYFEVLLQKHPINRRLRLYEGLRKSEILSSRPQDVINTVNHQIKAMKLADRVQSSKLPSMNRHKKSELVSLSDLPEYKEELKRHRTINKFETQSVSDTQLVEVVKKAELLSVEKEIMQEFDVTFGHNILDKSKYEVTILGRLKNISNDENNTLKSSERVSPDVGKDTQFDVTNLEIDTKFVSELFTKDKDESQCAGKVPEKHYCIKNIRASSPILNRTERETSPATSFNGSCSKNVNKNVLLRPVCHYGSNNKSKTPSPLIFELDAFEKFVTMALPIINENEYFATAKDLIKSQLLYRNQHPDPEISDCQEHNSHIMKTDHKELASVISKNKHEELDNVKINQIAVKAHGSLNTPTKVGNMKSNTSSKDEVVFSSDEDENYVHKESQDLSFIKVLESPNNKSKIFDKTLCLGLRITNNKSNHNTTESNSNLHWNYDELDNNHNKGFSLRELVVKLDDSLKHINENIEESIVYNNVTETNNTDKILLQPEDNCTANMSTMCITNLCKTTDSVTTVSEQELTIHEGASFISENITEDIKIGEQREMNMKDNFDKAANEKNAIISQISTKNTQVNEIPKPLNNILISNNIVDEHKLHEFKNSETLRHDPMNENNMSVKTANSSNKMNLTDSINHKNVENHTVSFTNFNGFKTASDKKIKISIESLSKTKNIFNDIQFTEKNIINIDKNFVNKASDSTFDNITVDKAITNGFKTASNKQIKISDQSFSKAKILFEDINNSVEIQEYHESGGKAKPMFLGFKTASRKQIKISNEALAKTKNFFGDISLNCNDADAKKFSNRNVKEQSIVKQTKISDIDLKVPPKSNLLGCKASNDGQINVCKQDIECSSNFQVSDQKNIVSKKSNCNNDELNSFVKNKTIFEGFQTASKKAVTISTEALAKSKKILENIERFEENNPVVTFNAKVQNLESDLLSKAERSNCSKKIIKNPFVGFQTCNNKEVIISEDALAKSRQILLDTDLFSQAKHNILDINNTKPKENDNSDLGNKSINFKSEAISHHGVFSIAVNKTDVVVENMINETIAKDVIVENSKLKYKKIDDGIIDSQILNNFEETLYSEDFHKETPASKRPASPILFSKAKKRKFKTPYSRHQKPILTINATAEVELKKSFHFDKDYKKCKVYRLKDIHKLESKFSNANNKVDNKFDNLLDFVFSGKRNDFTDTTLNIDELKEIFNNEVNKKLIPDGWLENHLKLILWKLLSYELVYPNTIGVACTVRKVLNQLKYRYDRELYNAERPALRKIIEKDDVPSNTLILCVMEILKGDSEERRNTNFDNKVEIVVTDGWYCVKACLDKMLTELVHKEKIVVGTKIVTNGAELLNCGQGMSPWEDTSSVRLKLFGNSTRRARWDAKLGYHGAVALPSKLSQVRTDGGKVSMLRVLVTRVYPALYIEKFEDGNTVTRSERLEYMHEAKYESDRQTLLEKLYEEVEREFSDQESHDSEDSASLCMKRKSIDNGSQMSKVMKTATDLSEVADQLTTSHTKVLEDLASKRQERLLRDVQAKLLEKMDKHGLCQKRNVVALLKVRVASIEEGKDGVLITKGSCHSIIAAFRKSSILIAGCVCRYMVSTQELAAFSVSWARSFFISTQHNVYTTPDGLMSIWKPSEYILELVKEGDWIDVMNVVPTSFRCSEINMSAGRQSIFKKAKCKRNENINPNIPPLLRKCYHIKELIINPSLTFDYNEIDTVGMIVSIEPSIQDFDVNKNQFQNVFLADENKNMICVNFWGGLKKFGYEKVLDTDQIVVCVNLQKRLGNARSKILQFRVTEFSYFTKSPKNSKTREMVEDLAKKLLTGKRKFSEECVKLKDNVARIKANENITPYRMQNVNLGKNQMFLDTQCGVKTNKIDEFDLTGLDFDSTFKQKDTQDLSPKTFLRRKHVQEKINRLKKYGEPPPLSPIHVINKSIITSYKSPLPTIESGVATTNVTKNCQLLNSPVTSMNRTYVKSLNPVKINFDNVNSKVQETDVFAEEFDGSPPLSLD